VSRVRMEKVKLNINDYESVYFTVVIRHSICLANMEFRFMPVIKLKRL